MEDFHIQIDEKEQKLFDLIIDVVQRSQCNSTIRVVGGWIRDKLLKRENKIHDLDLTVSNMEAAKFVSIFTKYTNFSQFQVQQSKCNDSVKVIKSNPKQHKFLETAQMTVLDFKIELTSLRCSSYANSKTEDIILGTAQEDAFGRDFTMNSIFYNINEHLIEDFTGHGIHDLLARVIDTPLEPQLTLTHDPLRVLRCIRFALQLNFTIHDRVKEWLRHESIHNQLNIQVSRERIWEELNKMMTGDQSSNAIEMLHEFELYRVVFCNAPDSPNFWTKESANLCLQTYKKMKTFGFLDSEDIEFKLLSIATYLLPLSDYRRISSSTPSDSILPITKFQMKIFWRWPKPEVETIVMLIEGSRRTQALSDLFCKENKVDILQTGLLLRELGKLWIHSFHMILCEKLCQSENYNVEQSFNSFVQHLKDVGQLGNQPIWTLQPFYKGKELSDLLGVTGPKLGRFLQRALEWQILNPDKTKQQCTQWLLDQLNHT